MFVELIEWLRCPRHPDATPLVVASTRTENRYIVDGVLGCPTCAAEFPVRQGIAHFGDPGLRSPADPPSDEVAMRLAAFLQLTDATGAALLCGRFASQAARVGALAETPLVLVNAPDGGSLNGAAGAMLVGDVLPIVSGVVRGAAIDEAASPALVRSIVSALKQRGRIVAPVSLARPDGVDELARDERLWVGEKTGALDGAPRLVTLKRASP